GASVLDLLDLFPDPPRSDFCNQRDDACPPPPLQHSDVRGAWLNLSKRLPASRDRLGVRLDGGAGGFRVRVSRNAHPSAPPAATLPGFVGQISLDLAADSRHEALSVDYQEIIMRRAAGSPFRVRSFGLVYHF